MALKGLSFKIHSINTSNKSKNNEDLKLSHKKNESDKLKELPIKSNREDPPIKKNMLLTKRKSLFDDDGDELDTKIRNQSIKNNLVNKDSDPLDAFLGIINDPNTKEPHLIKENNLMELDEDNNMDESKSYVEDKLFSADVDDLSDISDLNDETDTHLDIIEQAKQRLASKRKDLAPIDHSLVDYEPFRKDFYVCPPHLENLSKEDIDIMREELDNVRVRGQKCPAPINKWTYTGLSSQALHIIEKVLHFKVPTPIQAQAIPAIMSGRDVIGIAKTGSGKTLAFLLPLLRHVSHQRKVKKDEGPIALIMSPTRELAIQIYKNCRPFAKLMDLRAVCCYGGSAITEQIADLKRGAEIVICTPGRMLDLLCANNGRVTNLRRITYLVLDEADRMFDLGFEPQVMRIVNNIRSDKQTILFSATFPKKMEALARKILKKPIEITVGGKSVVGKDITQHVEVRNEDTKFIRTLQILGDAFAKDENAKILIFVDRQESADILFTRLLKNGYPCLSLHGGKDQEDRITTINDFKNGSCNVLVATSVAARGLDVKQLQVVINFDCPNHMEDYVHRCGRTGRAGSKGDAFTYITPMQDRYASHIKKALVASGAYIPAELEDLCKSFEQKVASGTTTYLSSGFGGKGLENLEKERNSVKKIQLSSHGVEYDMDQDEDISDLDSNAINSPEPSVIRDLDIKPKKKLKQDSIVKQSINLSTNAIEEITKSKFEETKPQEHSVESIRAPSTSSMISDSSDAISSPKTASSSPSGTKTKPNLSAALLAAKQRACLINASKMGSTNTQRPADSPSSNVQSILNRINSEIAHNLPSQQNILNLNDLKKSKGKSQDYTGEVYINDYPQKARWKVTNKEMVDKLSDMTGAAITMRGTFFPPGKEPKGSEKKLHLYLESDNPLSIEKAQREIKRLLAESTVASLESTSGRYTL